MQCNFEKQIKRHRKSKTVQQREQEEAKPHPSTYLPLHLYHLIPNLIGVQALFPHIQVTQHLTGRAWELPDFLARATSAARRRTRPWRTLPPALFHLGSSSERTLLTFSPLFRRLMRVDDLAAPQPTLKDQLTSAPNWL
jgi:hypothetical protein